MTTCSRPSTADRRLISTRIFCCSAALRDTASGEAAYVRSSASDGSREHAVPIPTRANANNALHFRA
ncbi:hypothetical protein AB0467_12210 [Streptomyces sp. NPDC052095]|uniref:hypothetical protein n=1 Tax=unclassified Streptomyces TaxID=2593676 RepID=UPI00344D11E9